LESWDYYFELPKSGIYFQFSCKFICFAFFGYLYQPLLSIESVEKEIGQLISIKLDYPVNCFSPTVILDTNYDPLPKDLKFVDGNNFIEGIAQAPGLTKHKFHVRCRFMLSELESNRFAVHISATQSRKLNSVDYSNKEKKHSIQQFGLWMFFFGCLGFLYSLVMWIKKKKRR